VLQAGAIGNPGDVLVLDMGEPVKIVDVAQRLIDESGRDLAITFTGLRQGEKLDEALLSSLEDGVPSDHPLITRVAVPPLSPGEVLLDDRELAQVGDLLADLHRETQGAPGAPGGAGPHEWGAVR